MNPAEQQGDASEHGEGPEAPPEATTPPRRGWLGRMRDFFMGSEATTTEGLPEGVEPGSDLAAEFTRLRTERDDLNHRLLRLAADLDNMRKRTSREVDAARQRERENVLRGLIEVLDNFERALAAGGAEHNEWIEGLEGIRLQMLEVLRRHGARPFEALGEKFDPVRHEALSTVPTAEKAEGTIVEVIQTGYAFDDGTVLRPAKVLVARPPA